jgi:hypothetical protein
MTDKPLTLERLNYLQEQNDQCELQQSDVQELIDAARASVEQTNIEDDATEPVFALKQPHPPWAGDAQEREEGMSELQRLGQEFDAATLPKSEGVAEAWERASANDPDMSVACQSAGDDLMVAYAKLVEEVDAAETYSKALSPTIARLRTQNDRLKKERGALCEMCDAMMKTEDLLRKEGKTLRAENERLREALGEIASFRGRDQQTQAEIARAALQSKGERE